MLYQPRAERWLGIKKNKKKKLVSVIDIEKNFIGA